MADNGLRAFKRAVMSPQDTQFNTISCISLPKIKLNTVKTALSDHSKNLVFKTDYRLMQVKSIAILLIFIKLPFVIKILLCLLLIGRLRQVLL